MKSLFKAIEILEKLSLSQENGVNLTELTKQMNLPKSTVYTVLKSFKKYGFVEQNEDTKKYRLGLRIFELGNLIQSYIKAREVALPYLVELTKFSNETTYLVLLSDSEIVYVECIESKANLRSRPIFGEKAQLHCTAVGKAIMAFLPKEKVEKIIKNTVLKRYTKNTITDPTILKNELSNIRNNGYSIDNVEHEKGIFCIGAPIYNHKNEVFAAISLSGPVQRFSTKKVKILSKKIVEVSFEISKKLGLQENLLKKILIDT